MSDTLVRTSAPLSHDHHIHWGPVFAGALTAAALASVLHAFAGAIGLAVSSTAPTWRDASIALWILSGIYLVFVALLAYGVGGYVAGLLRQRHGTATVGGVPGTTTATTATPGFIEELELRDGLHGLLVWALATLMTVLLLLLAASVGTRLAAPSADAAGPSASVAGENIIAFDLDRLLRGDRRQGEDVSQTRAEAARILLTSSSHKGVAAEDRAYLVRLVSARTGLAPPEAERRVDAALASSKENIARARRSTVILAFMAGAAAILGAAAAWFAAVAGGEERDDRGHARWRLFDARRTTSRAFP
jgi:hypothetical protein